MAGRPYTYKHGQVRHEVLEYVQSLDEFTNETLKEHFDYEWRVLSGCIRWMHNSGYIRKVCSKRTGTPCTWKAMYKNEPIEEEA